MKLERTKSLIFYITLISLALCVTYFIIGAGQANLETSKVTEPIFTAHGPLSYVQQFIDAFHPNLTNGLSIFILQILVIIVVARFFAILSTKIGQPGVIGEIFAGIFLGPSIVGAYFPEFSAFIFPPDSLGNLKFLSQVGLILFMFVVGMELDLKVLRTKAHEAVLISHISMICPFMLGTGLAYYIYLDYAPANIPFLPFALFMGIAMSITAFPVLARIVRERELTRSPIGTLVITCAAADDISAWCLFAAVVAIVKAGSLVTAGYTIFLAVIYVIIMIKVIRPFLIKLSNVAPKENLGKGKVALFFILVLLSSYVTELIGIHAIFGAFMAGVIMPPDFNFRKIFTEKIEDVAVIIFLPLFFVFTGLRTQISLLDNEQSWKICGIITLVAVIGKFAGSAIAAKFVGQSWKNSIIIGSLMNTRGLMELIILNIGYDLGILSPAIFAMMVIMALATTCMAGPVLDFMDWILPEKHTDASRLTINETPIAHKSKVMIAFGDPEKGKALLRIAKTLWGTEKTSYTALYVIQSEEMYQYNFDDDNQDNHFLPMREEADRLGVKLNTIFKVTQSNISKEITKQTDQGHYDFLIVGIGSSIYKGTLLGKLLSTSIRIINPEQFIKVFRKDNQFIDSEIVGEKTRYLLAESNYSLGVFFNKNSQATNQLLVVILCLKDNFLLSYARRAAMNNKDLLVTIVDAADLTSNSAEFTKELEAFQADLPANLRIITKTKLDEEFFTSYDLMLIGYDSWKKFVVNDKSLWFIYSPSTLIIKHNFKN